MNRKHTPSAPIDEAGSHSANSRKAFWLPRCFLVFGLIAVMNVLNLFVIAGVAAGRDFGLVTRISLAAATPIVAVQKALPLPVGDLLLAIFLVSLAEAAPVLLVWWAISKTRSTQAT